MPEHPPRPSAGAEDASLPHGAAPEWADIAASFDWSQEPAAVWTPAGAEHADPRSVAFPSGEDAASSSAGASGGASAAGWFPGGRLDAVWNLVHRHAAAQGARTAVHWEGEPGDSRSLTYAELSVEVEAMASALRELGLAAGDVVAIHASWLPETVITMLACNRLGAPWATVPVSIPAEALSTRIAELSPKLVLTQDGAWRRGSVLPLKSRADEALASADSVEHTVVVRRTGIDVQWFHGDMWFSDLIARRPRPAAGPGGPGTGAPQDSLLCVRQLASHSSAAQYLEHSLAGVLANAAAFHATARRGETFWCAGDVSWAVSTWHGLLGPLLAGDTVVVYEGTLDIPDHSRLLEIVEKYGVSTLVTNPAVMRTLRSWRIETELHARPTALRHVVTAGEPVEPALRTWMQEAFTRGECTVSDAWGQIELGGIVYAKGPGVDFNPGGAVAVGADGERVPAGRSGQLVLTRPLPGRIEGASSLEPFTAAGRVVPTGDIVEVAADGGFRFHGRVDAVVSVSGQLVSLEAVARALREHPYVADAAALRLRHDEYGNRIVACVVTTGEPGGTTAHELASTVRTELGGLARPQAIVFVDRIDPAVPHGRLADAVESLLTEAAWSVLAWDRIAAALEPSGD
ncbi:acyl-CoA synthetase [Brevibacterium album]|uniref:acyl-CoA synthetase n=1 Tax=Brevibacterium album TaxID=417948 RepID=UPI000415C44A|nr:AMP-binding protein [Brevibacterium album]